MNESIFNVVNRIDPAEMERREIITPARTKANCCPTYICECGNGTGESGDGLTVTQNDAGRFNYKCWRCGKSFSNVDLIAVYLGIDAENPAGRKDLAKELEEMFNNRTSIFSGTQTKNARTDVSQKTEKKETDFSKFYYPSVQKNLPAFIDEQGGKWRGLTLETLQNYGCGVDNESAEYTKSGKIFHTRRVIIPSSNTSYLARLVGEESDYLQNLHEGETANIHPKKHNGRKIPFNIDSLADYDTKRPIFIVEGAIDAMSITQTCPFNTAIATGGAGEKQSLLTALNEKIDESNRGEYKFVVMFDNDDAGRKGAAPLVELLRESGYCAVNAVLDKEMDANKMLQKDSGKLTERLYNILADSKGKLKETPTGINRADYFKHFFDVEVSRIKGFENRKTGFDNLDKEQQLFLPGIYLLGAMPATGKTTFCWQLLEHLAAEGESCYFASYEMSRLQMFSKSLSRRIFEKVNGENDIDYAGRFSSSRIASGAYKYDSLGNPDEYAEKLVQDEVENLIASKDNIQILELSDEKIEGVIKRFESVCNTAKPPIICLDYLQIIPSEGKTIKEQIDSSIRKLKVFQRETNSTLIVVSSFNRSSYDSPAKFESFKESGNIEFTADVVFGLELLADGKDIQDAKKDNPRSIRLSCLKNRFGSLYNVYFTYYPANDCFKPDKEPVTSTNSNIPKE